MLTDEGRRAIGFTAAAGVAAALVVLLVPGEVGNVWTFFAYLVPFVLALEATASLPHAWFRRYRIPEVLGVAIFVVVFCGFVPKLFAKVLENDFPGFYELMRILTPLLILAFAFMLRIGGGAAARVRRVGYASLLVMLSGLEDLMFHVWRGGPIPERWDWADHMTVRLGHVASTGEAYVFIAVHLLLAAAVLFLPVRALRARFGRAPAVAAERVPARQR